MTFFREIPLRLAFQTMTKITLTSIQDFLTSTCQCDQNISPQLLQPKHKLIPFFHASSITNSTIKRL